ncbi:FHA domain-containing protein [Streptomyces sp. NPDC048751]|uniref:FHA domain-containing protein n=1 Tax=Streptomyces sp. NPDC048751 TaxID=3365591 RepID=UPI003720D8CB
MGSGKRLRTCPCGVRPTTPAQLVCRGCLTPLRLTVRPATQPVPARAKKKTAAVPVAAGVTVRDPVRPASSAGLKLQFSTGSIVVPVGKTVILGRERQGCPDGEILERFHNLSRRHATVFVDPDGTGWIRDEDSTNGTFLDGRRLSPGSRVRLKPGDSLRLAADVHVRVLRCGRR